MTSRPHHESSDKPAQLNDNAATGQKLLEDLQGKIYSSSKPDAVQQLVKDGILPAGSTVIDFGTVKNHLDIDKQKMQALGAETPVDTKAATSALDDSKKRQTESKSTLEAAQSKIDPIEGRMTARTQQDEQVKQDFATVSAVLKKGSIERDDLTKLAADQSKSETLRTAAQNLLNTFKDETYVGHTRNGRNVTLHRETNDYIDHHTFSGKPYFDKDTIDAGINKHHNENAADQKTLEPLKAARDQAKVSKDGADMDVTAKQTDLDKLNTHNQSLDDQKRQLANLIKEEQMALTPSSDLDRLGRVVRGGGYYQIAENLLGLDKTGHSLAQEKELKMLTRLLQDESKQLHNGQLPKYLVQNDQILKPENLQRVLDKLKTAAPDQTRRAS